jgi:hypothetical protein
MKTLLLICLLLTISTLPLYPLEGWFAGLGAEANAHTREAAAAGGGLSFGLDISRNFALGLKAAISYNFDTVAAVEPMAFFRYYPPLGISGPFIQAEAGAVVYFEYGLAYPAFSGGLALGWRFVLGITNTTYGNGHQWVIDGYWEITTEVKDKATGNMVADYPMEFVHCNLGWGPGKEDPVSGKLLNSTNGWYISGVFDASDSGNNIPETTRSSTPNFYQWNIQMLAIIIPK